MRADCRSIVVLGVVGLLVLFAGAASAEWISLDINAQEGSTEYDEASGLWTIEASGADIWGNADGFRFVYQEVSGDFEISAQILTLENTDPWAKGGVMARTSATSPAAYAFSFVTFGNGTSFQWRLTDGDRAWPDGSGTAGTAPYYIKLVREGDLFRGLRSQDGADWEENMTVGQASEIEVVMDDPITAGIALTSHSAGALCTAEFDNLEATFDVQAVDPAGKLPVVWAKLKTLQ